MKALIVALALSFPIAAAAQTVPPLTPGAPLGAVSPTEFTRLGLYFSDSSAFSAGWDSIVSLPVADARIVRGFYRASDGIFVLVLEDDFGTVLAQSPVWQLRAGLERLDLTALHTDGAVWPDLGLQGVGLIVVFGYDRQTGAVVRSRIYWPNPHPAGF